MFVGNYFKEPGPNFRYSLFIMLVEISRLFIQIFIVDGVPKNSVFKI